MDDPATPPLVFANRVIRQFTDHLVGSDVTIEPKDYMVIRLLFRKGGGQWTEIVRGNVIHLSFLEKLVTSWGNLPGRKKEQSDG